MVWQGQIFSIQLKIYKNYWKINNVNIPLLNYKWLNIVLKFFYSFIKRDSFWFSLLNLTLIEFSELKVQTYIFTKSKLIDIQTLHVILLIDIWYNGQYLMSWWKTNFLFIWIWFKVTNWFFKLLYLSFFNFEF